MNLIAYLLKRFSERETWIALSTFMGGASYYFTTAEWDDVIALGMAACSLAYALFPKNEKVKIIDSNSNSITTTPLPEPKPGDNTPSIEDVVSDVAAVASVVTPAPEIIAIAKALHSLINLNNSNDNSKKQ
jgi:hypothetical protein